MKKLIPLLLVILLINFIPIYAAPLDLNSETLAVSIVIDTSGSMYNTDPNRLREDVADAFIDFLYPEDYLSIITFNDNVDLVIPLQQLKDSNIKTSFKEQLSPMLFGTATTNTDYKAGLEEAYKQLNALYKSDVTKLIIFLTDGKPDPDPAYITNNPERMNNYMNELWATVGGIAGKNYPIYSIGFSDGIDVEVLNRIAAETNGDVRIFKDSADLDANLVQMLKSRETIVAELLATETTGFVNSVNVMPTLRTDFWIKDEGYRNGEEAVISVFLMVGSRRMNSGNDLIVDKFELEIDYEDGNNITLPLYDDGNFGHSDIKANDGIWSNKIVFNRNGKASANLIVSGKLKDEDITLNKEIGQYFVADTGKISLTSYEKDLWIKNGERLSIPIRLNSNSAFKETILVELLEGFGTLRQTQIELDPKENKGLKLDIDLAQGLENKVHDIRLSFRPLNPSTTIDIVGLEYRVEVVSTLENLYRKFVSNSIIILPIIGIVIGLPLFIFLFGMLLYLILAKPQLKVKGSLSYWKEVEPENKVELDLTKIRKNMVTLTFHPEKAADFRIEGSPFYYDIILSKVLIKKGMKFILGWKALFSKNGLAELKANTTQPGIMDFEGDIYTSINLFNGDEFSSGAFRFKYTKIGKSKEAVEGRNLLEGRV